MDQNIHSMQIHKQIHDIINPKPHKKEREKNIKLSHEPKKDETSQRISRVFSLDGMDIHFQHG